MNPLQIDPQQAVQELLDFSRRLAEGVDILGGIDPVEVAPLPREAVYREDRLTLYHYTPRVAKPHPIPLMVVYSLVNRPYMLDLEEERSLLRRLLECGIDIYLIDWGYPEASDRFLTLEDYIDGYLHRCLEEVCHRHGIQAINLMGVCQGGVFSLCYTALHTQQVERLVTMVTPVDFHTPDNLLTHLTRHLDTDLLVDTLGNLPGELLNFTFLSLNPFRLAGQKYIDLVVDNLDDKTNLLNFLRMEKWIFDSPDQAGEAFRQFVKEFFQNNRLIQGELRLGGHRVELGRIECPLLNIYATQDHLVPPAAARALAYHHGSRHYRELAFQGGHIGLYVSQRAQHWIPAAIADWLREEDESG